MWETIIYIFHISALLMDVMSPQCSPWSRKQADEKRREPVSGALSLMAGAGQFTFFSDSQNYQTRWVLQFPFIVIIIVSLRSSLYIFSVCHSK